MTAAQLLPCPLCGLRMGYWVCERLLDSHGELRLICNGCAHVVAELAAFGSIHRIGPDERWNAVAEHAESLRAEIRNLDLDLRRCRFDIDNALPWRVLHRAGKDAEGRTLYYIEARKP